jgi:hypothetical protein
MWRAKTPQNINRASPFYTGGTFHLRGKTESLQADILGKM